MQPNRSSVRLTLRKMVRVGLFLVVAGVLGVSLALIAGAFVLGDLSGAWQPEKLVPEKDGVKGSFRISYVPPDLRGARPLPVNAAPELTKPLIPAPLAPVAPDAVSEPVRVARAIPVLPDVPVRQAQPIRLTVPAEFDVRAEVADDQFIPRARPVSPAELAVQNRVGPDQSIADSVAQRDAISVSW